MGKAKPSDQLKNKRKQHRTPQALPNFHSLRVSQHFWGSICPPLTKPRLPPRLFLWPCEHACSPWLTGSWRKAPRFHVNAIGELHRADVQEHSVLLEGNQLLVLAPMV